MICININTFTHQCIWAYSSQKGSFSHILCFEICSISTTLISPSNTAGSQYHLERRWNRKNAQCRMYVFILAFNRWSLDIYSVLEEKTGPQPAFYDVKLRIRFFKGFLSVHLEEFNNISLKFKLKENSLKLALNIVIWIKNWLTNARRMTN